MNNKKYIVGLIATALVTEAITLYRANRVIKKQAADITQCYAALTFFDAILTEPDAELRAEMQSVYNQERTFAIMTAQF